MRTKLTGIVVALMAVAAPAWAGDDPVSILAHEADLTERKVQMVLGNRTAFAEYRYTYDRSVERIRTAIGPERYDKLMNSGELIAATPQTKARALLAALEENRRAGDTP